MLRRALSDDIDIKNANAAAQAAAEAAAAAAASDVDMGLGAVMPEGWQPTAASGASNIKEISGGK